MGPPRAVCLALAAWVDARCKSELKSGGGAVGGPGRQPFEPNMRGLSAITDFPVKKKGPFLRTPHLCFHTWSAPKSIPPSRSSKGRAHGRRRLSWSDSDLYGACHEQASLFKPVWVGEKHTLGYGVVVPVASLHPFPPFCSPVRVNCWLPQPSWQLLLFVFPVGGLALKCFALTSLPLCVSTVRLVTAFITAPAFPKKRAVGANTLFFQLLVEWSGCCREGWTTRGSKKTLLLYNKYIFDNF